MVIILLNCFRFRIPPHDHPASRPEAAGLRHLAFAVTDIQASVQHLNNHGVVTEPIRTDEYTQKKFTFFADPDGLPLEIYEL